MRGEHVERCQRESRALKRLDRRLERGDDLLVQPALARQRTLLRRQRLVLECLELRRDVALGVLHRLPPPVVVGNALHVGVRHLDIEAVHAVEFDLETGYPRSLPLARFEVDQERAAVVLDRAQLVELGVVAGRDHVAVAHRGRGLGGDRSGQELCPARFDRERGCGGDKQRRLAVGDDVASTGRRCSVSRSPARSRGRAQRSAMRDAMRSISTVASAPCATRRAMAPRPSPRSPRGAKRRRTAHAAGW